MEEQNEAFKHYFEEKYRYKRMEWEADFAAGTKMLSLGLEKREKTVSQVRGTVLRYSGKKASRD